MSNGTSFSWLAFLLGLAIGLWISFVVFFLIGDDDKCCTSGATQIITQPTPGDPYAPGGDGDYFCTNDDQGRAIVIDQGRAVVADQGRAIVIDQGRAVVADQGRAVVADSGGFVPVPKSAQLGEPREFEEFKCDSNDQGGAIVADRSDRIVVVAMPNTYSSEQCHVVDGDAVVVDSLNATAKIVHIKSDGQIHIVPNSSIDSDGNAVSSGDQPLPAEPRSETDLAYCMVPKPGTALNPAVPIVIRPVPAPNNGN